MQNKFGMGIATQDPGVETEVILQRASSSADATFNDQQVLAMGMSSCTCQDAM
jgi:hypothetical protein